MPCELTSTVVPSFELEAVFTTVPEPPELTWEDVAAPWVFSLPLLLELLPHAEISADTASVGMSTFIVCRIWTPISQATRGRRLLVKIARAQIPSHEITIALIDAPCPRRARPHQ